MSGSFLHWNAIRRFKRSLTFMAETPIACANSERVGEQFPFGVTKVRIYKRFLRSSEGKAESKPLVRSEGVITRCASGWKAALAETRCFRSFTTTKGVSGNPGSTKDADGCDIGLNIGNLVTRKKRYEKRRTRKQRSLQRLGSRRKVGMSIGGAVRCHWLSARSASDDRGRSPTATAGRLSLYLEAQSVTLEFLYQEATGGVVSSLLPFRQSLHRNATCELYSDLREMPKERNPLVYGIESPLRSGGNLLESVRVKSHSMRG